MNSGNVLSIPFCKASGAGNDFVIIDNLDGWLNCQLPPLARTLCAKHTGIGADGLLVLEPSERADFRMEYFNADGSHGGMCGNGGRCIARYANLAGHYGRNMRFEALDYVYEATILESGVRLQMRDATGYRPGLRLTADRDQYAASFLDTGAPHAVLFVDDISSIDVERLGRLFRQDDAFSPGGANINFVHETGRSSLELRTYERGVEAETLACGTGSIAAALVSVVERGAELPIRVRVRSGEDLLVAGEVQGGSFSHITLEGSADIFFTGSVQYHLTTSTLLPISSL